MQLKGIVNKGWGSENIVITNDRYCGKFLNFNKGAKSSMHFHAAKDETWYVQTGKFIVEYIDTSTSATHRELLELVQFGTIRRCYRIA